MKHSKIVGLGHHVPETVITNQYLSTIMETTDEWIVERTGIKERRWIDPAKDTVANMAAKASRIALQRANLTEKDIDLLFSLLSRPTISFLALVFYFNANSVWMEESERLIFEMHVQDLSMPCRLQINL